MPHRPARPARHQPKHRAVPQRTPGAARARTAAAVVVPVAGLAALGAFAAPAGATPSPSAVLANTFPVQCQADGAMTVTGNLTVSAAGPASAAVGDTVTVTDYTVSLAVDSLPMDPAPFKGATPTFAVGGGFQSHTVLSGAITLGPVASTGSVGRTAVSSSGAATLAGPAASPLAFPASVAGPVTVTTASPIVFTLDWYLTKVTAAQGQQLPLGIPTADPDTPYGTSTLSCTGNPVLPWGTVQIVPSAAQAGVPGSLASTGSATENLAIAGGYVLVAGVAVSFAARRRTR